MQNLMILLSSDGAVIIYECVALLVLSVVFVTFRIKIRNSRNECDRQTARIKYAALEGKIKNRKRR